MMTNGFCVSLNWGGGVENMVGMVGCSSPEGETVWQHFFFCTRSDSLVYSGRWCGCSYLQVSRIQCEHISNFIKCLASHTVEMKSMFQVLLSVISADCSPGDLNSVVNTKSILMDRWYLIMDTGINCLWFSLNAVQSTFEYSSLENSPILCYPDTNRLLEIYQCIVHHASPKRQQCPVLNWKWAG